MHRGRQWSTVVSVYDRTGGRRQMRVTAKTRGEVRRIATKAQAESDVGSWTHPGSVTVAELCYRWLEHQRVRDREPLTPRVLEWYASVVRHHIAPGLGKLRLRRLATAHIDQFLDDLRDHGRVRGRGGLSPRTVRHVYAVLSSILRYGCRLGLLSVNPAEGADVPTVRGPSFPVIDPKWANRILASARGSEIEILVSIGIVTGFRLGECLGLRWADLDLNAGMSHVRQAVSVVNGEVVFKEPKTPKSRRQMPLGDEIVGVLREHRKAQLERRLAAGPEWHDHDLVIDRENGRPWTTDDASHAFARLADRHGFPDVRFHDLRHAFATLMLAAGVDLKVVSDLMGHTTIKTTADLYASVIERVKRDSVARLDALLAAAEPDEDVTNP